MTATAVAVRERPILFSGEMVRAILDGRKTQTRRVVLPQPNNPDVFGVSPVWGSGVPRQSVDPQQRFGIHAATNVEGKRVDRWISCPFGAVGDRLWVREAFSYSRNDEWHRSDCWYWADGNPSGGDWEKPKPSIHMPRWASRLTLEITGVRVERVQSISDADVEEEGIEVGCFVFCTTENCWRGADDDLLSTDGLCPKCGGSEFLTEEAQDLYANLWDSLNAKRGYGWNVNPWVWVIEFRRLES